MKNTKMTTAIVLIALIITTNALAKPGRGNGHVKGNGHGNGFALGQQKHNSPGKSFSFSISTNGFYFGTSTARHHPRQIFHRPIYRHHPRPNYQHHSVRRHYQPETVIVWVRQCNGRSIPVRIVRRGSLYYGPRGELYTRIPTEHQLRMIYGR